MQASTLGLTYIIALIMQHNFIHSYIYVLNIINGLWSVLVSHDLGTAEGSKLWWDQMKLFIWKLFTKLVSCQSMFHENEFYLK
jgi:hypothetical protein